MGFLKRWYDQDPVISLAVDYLEKSSPFIRKKVAQAIINKAKSLNIDVKELPVVLFRRWYDEDSGLSMAMEYFRVAEPMLQRAIAEFIINKYKKDLETD